jgi:hypothetical protein
MGGYVKIVFSSPRVSEVLTTAPTWVCRQSPPFYRRWRVDGPADSAAGAGSGVGGGGQAAGAEVHVGRAGGRRQVGGEGAGEHGGVINQGTVERQHGNSSLLLQLKQVITR